MSEHSAVSKVLTIVTLLLFALSGKACSIPSPSSLETPKPLLDTCKTDADCVLAIRIDVCCSCPEVTTQACVQATKGVEIYVPGRNYSSLLPARCAQVDCSPCPPPPASAICRLGRCRAPETLQEILAACPDCFAQAAEAAYRAGRFEQAVDFCTQSAPEQQYICFSQLFNTAVNKDRLDEADKICRQYLSQDVGSCLRRLALKWVSLDAQRAIALCNELDPVDARHFGCLVELALAIWPEKQDLAIEICNQLSPDRAEQCRQEVLK